MYAIRSYYEKMTGIELTAQAGNLDLQNEEGVITSYSIHYTKLYDTGRPPRTFGSDTISLMLSMVAAIFDLR